MQYLESDGPVVGVISRGQGQDVMRPEPVLVQREPPRELMAAADQQEQVTCSNKNNNNKNEVDIEKRDRSVSKSIFDLFLLRNISLGL